jgi:hypothetical protein
MYEIHTSVQNYDKDGAVVSCPIYFDLDGENALEDMRCLYTLIYNKMGCYPDVYFSGRRGFHLVIKHYIHHEKCNLIVRYIVNDICKGTGIEVDNQIYGNKHLMRVDGSRHFGGSYKIKLNPLEIHAPMDKIKELASQGRRTSEILKHNVDLDGIEYINELTVKAIELVNREPTYSKTVGDGSWKQDIQPCLYEMLTDLPDEGKRNMAIYLLARYFKSRGLTFEEALSVILNETHWLLYDAFGDVSKVFNNVFSSKSMSGVGCKGESAMADYMRSLCSKGCMFNLEGIENL